MSGDALAAYYAKRAAEYERIYDKPERQHDLARLRELIPGYLKGRDVVEIACGTGYWTSLIAQTARSVTAIDINEETLAIARSKPLPDARVSFGTADVYDLAPHYSGFTGAFAGFWWSHVPRGRIGEFLACLHRALTPGATVVLLDNLYVEGSSTPLSHRDAEGDTYQERALSDGSMHTVLKNFPTEGELRHDLEAEASAIDYIALEYYWLVRYVVRARTS